MVGNIGQWCQDLYTGPFPGGLKGPGPRNLRTFRGGFWDLGPAELRSARRFWSVPGAHSFYVGFRVVVSS
jgi:formylglycine-generating enzyme required for sulfatase activity